MTAKRALVFGADGQIGGYLTLALAQDGWQVWASSLKPVAPPAVKTAHCDITDFDRVASVVKHAEPSAIFNLAGITDPTECWEAPLRCAQVNGFAVVHILEAMRLFCPDATFIQAGSSEMFGEIATAATEDHPCRPVTPYGVAKLYACEITRQYREAHGLRAMTAILFNHTSERQSERFFIPKLVNHAARAALGLTDEPLTVGDGYHIRDFSHARDGAGALVRMIGSIRDEIILGSGIATSTAAVLELVSALVSDETNGARSLALSRVHLRRLRQIARSVAAPWKARALGLLPPPQPIERLIGSLWTAALARERTRLENVA